MAVLSPSAAARRHQFNPAIQRAATIAGAASLEWRYSISRLFFRPISLTSLI